MKQKFGANMGKYVNPIKEDFVMEFKQQIITAAAAARTSCFSV